MGTFDVAPVYNIGAGARLATHGFRMPRPAARGNPSQFAVGVGDILWVVILTIGHHFAREILEEGLGRQHARAWILHEPDKVWVDFHGMGEEPQASVCYAQTFF